jgi:prepilin-type N-terminal cleavage/methylation domain-containing protein
MHPGNPSMKDSRMKHSRMKEGTGFTLLELMVVVSLFGLFMLATIPLFSRHQQDFRLLTEADRLATTLRSARGTAVMKQINSVFEFDISSGTYSYFEDQNADGTRENDEYRSALFTLPTGITFKSHSLTVPNLTFGPKGNTSETGAIILSNRINRTKTILIYGGTGNVRIE